MVEINQNPIESMGENFYFWKLSQIEELDSNVLLSKLEEVKNQLTNNFFMIQRGRTEDLGPEVNKFANSLKILIPNFFIDEDQFLRQLTEIFNEFHFEEQNLISDKANEVVTNTSKSFKFLEVYPRLLLRDKLLVEEKQAFLNAVFEKKMLSTEVLVKYFKEYLADFIEGFNKNTENCVRDFCMRIEEEYIHTMNILVGTTRNKISRMIENIVRNNRLMRIKISNFEINSDNKLQKENWETAFEGLFITENVSLVEVTKLKLNIILISLFFDTSNLTFFIFIREFRSKLLEPLKSRSLVICQGSTLENFLVIDNENKLINQYCLIDEKKFVIKKQRPIDNKLVIKSAIFLVRNQEILYVNSDNCFGGMFLNDSPPREFIKGKKIYQKIIVSDCENYFALLSKTDLDVYTSDHKLKFSDINTPAHAFILNNHLKILLISERNEIYIKKVRLNNDPSNKSGQNNPGNAQNTILNTIVFGKELLNSFFKNQSYRVEPIDVVPTSNENLTFEESKLKNKDES